MLKTKQEEFWASAFGDEYLERNSGRDLLSSNINFFARSLGAAAGVSSCIEFGANIGMNLMALRALYPRLELHGLEINSLAAEKLREAIPDAQVYNESILDFQPQRTWELVLVKGVLIHINPDYLDLVYSILARSCERYLLIAEYYNPSPVSVEYRGHTERLFKRDFAGEVLDRHEGFDLIDYGFCYRRDRKFPQDDVTWFLLERK